MSLQEVNADTAQHILRYLGGRDAASVAQTSKLFAAEVRKNLYIVVEEHVCWGEAVPGMTWNGQRETDGHWPGYDVHYAVTKENALALAKDRQRGEQVFCVRVGLRKDFAEMYWGNYNEFQRSDAWVYVWNV